MTYTTIIIANNLFEAYVADQILLGASVHLVFIIPYSNNIIVTTAVAIS